MKAKPVQIAIIVIGLIVGVVGIVMAMGKHSSPRTASEVVLVDMKTGELFEASTRKRTLVLPAKNPDTGERSLMRVHFDEEQDAYVISGHYLDMLKEIEGITVPVDMETGKVDVDIDAKLKTLP